ncbi:MAG: SGNH/GDSL hydrolase family protein, partial [Verrucomicrobia bacterium]|nr:SGNH/GDSL hydrolase family protein [Verrucomicrobiota bacterium]
RARDTHSAFRLTDNPVLGYVLRENYRDDNPNLNDSWPVINSHGQRDIERTYDKPAGTTRIIMLGDSVVMGNGIRDLNDTLSRQLERQLQPDPIEVLNFGVSGYCTRSEVELLKVRGLQYDPDVVILVFVMNDYANISNDILNIDYDRAQWAQFFFVHSSLYRALAIRFNWLHFGDQFAMRAVAGDFTGVYPNQKISEVALRHDKIGRHANAIGERNVEEGLGLFKQLSLQNGFQPLIVIWPIFFDEQIGDVETYLEFNRDGQSYFIDPAAPLVIEKLAEQVGITTMRLSGHFRQDALERNQTSGLADLYTIGDGTHPSPEGTRVAARALKQFLQDHGPINR